MPVIEKGNLTSLQRGLHQTYHDFRGHSGLPALTKVQNKKLAQYETFFKMIVEKARIGYKEGTSPSDAVRGLATFVLDPLFGGEATGLDDPNFKEYFESLGIRDQESFSRFYSQLEEGAQAVHNLSDNQHVDGVDEIMADIKTHFEGCGYTVQKVIPVTQDALKDVFDHIRRRYNYKKKNEVTLNIFKEMLLKSHVGYLDGYKTNEASSGVRKFLIFVLDPTMKKKDTKFQDITDMKEYLAHIGITDKDSFNAFYNRLEAGAERMRQEGVNPEEEKAISTILDLVKDRFASVDFEKGISTENAAKSGAKEGRSIISIVVDAAKAFGNMVAKVVSSLGSAMGLSKGGSKGDMSLKGIKMASGENARAASDLNGGHSTPAVQRDSGKEAKFSNGNRNEKDAGLDEPRFSG